MKTTFLAKDVEKCTFVVLFGTQLGNSGSIAESIVDTAKSSTYNWTTLLYSLNQVKDLKELANTQCPIVIVTSTTGDGEAPENADRFWRQIHKKSLESNTFSQITYTLLGLGDTNFNNFCNCGKQINKRFQELGAQQFYPPDWADDAVGTERVVERWIEGLWTTLETLIRPLGTIPKKLIPIDQIQTEDIMEGNLNRNLDGGVGSDTVQLTLPVCPASALCLEYIEDSPEPIDLTNPPAPYPLLGSSLINAEILSARYLTKETAVKTAIEITFQTSKVFDFEPGDAIGIICPNAFEEVDLLLERLGVSEKADKTVLLSLKNGVKGKFPVHIPKKTTLRNALLNYCDIRAISKKAFIRLLGEHTSDLVERNTLLHLCSKEGSVAFEENIRGGNLSLLDILMKFPSCQPPIESILENMPRLTPRAYSIASSPLQSDTTFTIAFNIIHIAKESGRQYNRLGVCTGWLFERSNELLPDSQQNDFGALKALSPDDKNISKTVLFYKRKNHNFRLPSDLKAPIIMVGPGTGVVPFVGFLQHRNLQKQSGSEIGDLILYFGCRHKERDYLFEEVLKEFRTDGILKELNVSFSRDEDENNLKYVQDYMVANKESLVKTLLDDHGYFYVCGDAQNMAKNVREKLVLCIQDVKGITEKEALGHIADLVLSKRYLQDIWA